MHVSFVIPVYNERETIEPLVTGICQHVSPNDYTILLVDDGSTDGSYEVMQRLHGGDPRVKVVRLRGNFGKSAALATGFAMVEGDIVFTMDSDLQDDPKEIPRFIEKLDEGYDVVCGWKARRFDPWHKTIPSRFYNAFASRLFHLPLHDVNCGYKAFRVEVVKRIQVYGEMHRLIPVLAHNLNYRVGEIPVEHHKRRYGVSKYGFERFSRGALDVLTMYFLCRNQHAPGHFFGKLGGMQALIGFVLLVWGGILGFNNSAAPWFLALWTAGFILGTTGMILVGMGLLAELVLRHFIRIDPALYATESDAQSQDKENGSVHE